MSDKELEGESLKIWNEIKDVQLDLFGLPDQTVEKVCKPVMIDPSKLYVTANASAVFAALDAALNTHFDLELFSKWYVISRKVKQG